MYCSHEAPGELQIASTDTADLRAWVKKQDMETLLKAMDWLHVREPDINRRIVREEIDARRHAQLDEHFNALREPHWTITPTFWLALLSAIAAIVSCFLAWYAWRKPVATEPPSNPVWPAQLRPESPQVQSPQPPAQIQSSATPAPPSVNQPSPGDAPKSEATPPTQPLGIEKP